MTEELKPGDEVWVRAEIIGKESDDYEGSYTYCIDIAGVQPVMWPNDSDIRKSPPSEHSETAELERKVVEAAREWQPLADFHAPDTIEEQQARLAVWAAVDDLQKALAPPSLEDEIKARFRIWESGDEASECNTTDALIADILVLVKAHDS